MLLTSLKNFTWYNEPHDVSFGEQGMLVTSKAQTDFWQSSAHHFHKDDGHFFYTEKNGDFDLTLQWYSEENLAFSQCGLMIRVDNLNWAKIGILSPDLKTPQIGSVVTTKGNSDWAILSLNEYQPRLWYRIKVRGGDCLLFYSLDGEKFIQVRQFRLNDYQDAVKVGAYTCSPWLPNFTSILEMLEFS